MKTIISINPLNSRPIKIIAAFLMALLLVPLFPRPSSADNNARRNVYLLLDVSGSMNSYVNESNQFKNGGYGDYSGFSEDIQDFLKALLKPGEGKNGLINPDDTINMIPILYQGEGEIVTVKGKKVNNLVPVSSSLRQDPKTKKWSYSRFIDKNSLDRKPRRPKASNFSQAIQDFHGPGTGGTGGAESSSNKFSSTLKEVLKEDQGKDKLIFILTDNGMGEDSASNSNDSRQKSHQEFYSALKENVTGLWLAISQELLKDKDGAPKNDKRGGLLLYIAAVDNNFAGDKKFSQNHLDNNKNLRESLEGQFKRSNLNINLFELFPSIDDYRSHGNGGPIVAEYTSGRKIDIKLTESNSRTWESSSTQNSGSANSGAANNNASGTDIPDDIVMPDDAPSSSIKASIKSYYGAELSKFDNIAATVSKIEDDSAWLSLEGGNLYLNIGSADMPAGDDAANADEPYEIELNLDSFADINDKKDKGSYESPLGIKITVPEKSAAKENLYGKSASFRIRLEGKAQYKLADKNTLANIAGLKENDNKIANLQSILNAFGYNIEDKATANQSIEEKLILKFQNGEDKDIEITIYFPDPSFNALPYIIAAAALAIAVALIVYLRSFRQSYHFVYEVLMSGDTDAAETDHKPVPVQFSFFQREAEVSIRNQKFGSFLYDKGKVKFKLNEQLSSNDKEKPETSGYHTISPNNWDNITLMDDQGNPNLQVKWILQDKHYYESSNTNDTQIHGSFV